MFSQHPKAIFWSKKNTLQPCEVALNSHKNFGLIVNADILLIVHCLILIRRIIGVLIVVNIQ